MSNFTRFFRAHKNKIFALTFVGLGLAVFLAFYLVMGFSTEWTVFRTSISALLNFIITLFCYGYLLFTNIYNDINARYRYFKGYEGGLKPTEEVEYLKKSDELCYVNGLYVYPVYVRYFIGINCQDKVIFALKNDLDYEIGDKLTITTYQRILIKAEKHS